MCLMPFTVMATRSARPGDRRASAHTWTATFVMFWVTSSRSMVATIRPTTSGRGGAGSVSKTRWTAWLISASASSAMAAMMSSLLGKYRYTAPADNPASASTSCIEVAWNPLRTKHRRAADLAAPGVEMLLRDTWHGVINLKRMIVLDKQRASGGRLKLIERSFVLENLMNSCLRRHAVVTGSASGIGRATALRLAADGYHVFAGVRREADG